MVVSTAVIIFVGTKVFHILNTANFSSINFHPKAVLIFLSVVLLLILNWGLETKKWQILTERIQPMSYSKAFKGVLQGVATGIITPNRLGNFIGRVANLPKELRLKATLLTLLSNLSQFVVTIFFGCVGIILTGVSYFDYSTVIIFMAGALLMLLALDVYLQPKLLNRKPFNYFFTAKIEADIEYVSEEDKKLKLLVLFLSVCRYLVFVIQFVLVLIAFNQRQDLADLFTSIFVVYLLMTLIPSLFFGKLFVREASALLVLSGIGVGDEIIILSGFVIWCVNIGIPAIIGGILFLKKDV